ncbi:hypothetical protein PDG61_04855 [Mycolicibacterium sp. BiH015]|uniref:hypothetical protein n=1 Tax=Mycolicibacterium sp. BiH015 TaxID=3018808 RepID=UPI0022E786F8|nr:hypothetical protein [Mycolicibacterium sp. BiH015]MDA2890232.1 hypothetical protein [Mycolicibacterium sp. BiH015]
MNLTNFARAALVAGAVTGASLGMAGNAAATTVSHAAAPVSSIAAPSTFAPAPVTALGSWRGKKDDDGGDSGGDVGGDSGGDVGGGDDYSSAVDDAGPDYDTGADYAEVPDDPAPAEESPDVVDAPDDQPPAPESDAPDTDSSPEAPEAPQSPEAPQAPEAPETPEAPEVPEAPQATEEPEAPEAPEAPQAPETPEAPQAPEAPPAPEALAPPQAPEAPEAPQAPETPDTPDSPPVNADPTTATPQDIDSMRTSIMSSFSGSSSWSSQVSAWNSSWLSYNTYGLPVLFNSYAAPMEVFYTYGGATRTVTIPPQQRVVLPATTPGRYGFTSVVRTPQGGVSHVSVGSFTAGGGGGHPAPTQGASAPQPQRNVWVQLNYSTGTSQPFRVGSLTDLGEDSAVGAHRVLIDGSVSAWGEWSKNPDGSAQFEVSKTDQLPGLTAPSEAPLPGYDVSLVSKESSATTGVTQVLPWVALAAGALGLGSAGGALLMGRRRRAEGSQ